MASQGATAEVFRVTGQSNTMGSGKIADGTDEEAFGIILELLNISLML